MPPSPATSFPEVEYHAARVLLVIAYCGRPTTKPQIKGRTLLAKLDFFLRYPVYLERAAQIRTSKSLAELNATGLLGHEIQNVETRMIRYKYGPWDKVYYSVLAYLIGKGLILVELKSNVEYFQLTASGGEVVNTLSTSNAYAILASRARLLKTLFPGWTGSSVKQFIYENFSEILTIPWGREI